MTTKKGIDMEKKTTVQWVRCGKCGAIVDFSTVTRDVLNLCHLCPECAGQGQNRTEKAKK